jgi:hypothetical protein
MPKQYLTKSRFKVGYECPTKLSYLDDKAYGNNNVDNSFLEALAEGGFQVGELAKLYHPGGTEITTIDKDLAAAQTAELLQQKNAVIYEAAFKFENMFVKTDVVIKKGEFIELIEVKAKSYDPTIDDQFYNKNSLKGDKPELSSKWEEYIVDITFQTYVFKLAYPKLKVTSSLMLADKSAHASVDGLNQRFLLVKGDSGTSVKVDPKLTREKLGDPVLVKVGVDDEIKIVMGMLFENGMGFEGIAKHLADVCADQKFIKPTLGGKCKSCEFRISAEAKASGKKSGFEQCWTKSAKLKAADFLRPFVFDIWNFKKSADLIADGTFFIDQLSSDDLNLAPKAAEAGLSTTERQWLQIEKIQRGDKKPFLDISGLRAEFNSWVYPLHFIDFETTMAAIPFNKGRRPYEQIAFQFSHHIVTEQGKVIHQDEYINREKGHFPNFDFVRTLKAALSKDDGTIFRYAAHENTVLNQIKDQMLASNENISDRTELIAFIDSITAGTGKSKARVGNRNMVDLCELVKKYFYSPHTKGSNSIKKVLPAVLNESAFLREKYSKSIYGDGQNISSKNFKNQKWIELNSAGEVVDPYKLLPPIFTDLDLATMDSLVLSSDSIADGGAAMTAYARMQFTEMSDAECDRVASALLKYCELDTFAMVLIYEYWKNEIEIGVGRKKSA